MVAGLDGHAHAHVVPPVQSGPDREHDPLLGRRLVGAGGHEQSGTADAVGVELLDHDTVKQRFELAAHDVFDDRALPDGGRSGQKSTLSKCA